MRGQVRIGVAMIVAVVALVAAPFDAAAPAATNAAVRAVPLHSSYETATRAVSRDVGISVALPDGHDLWLFGDTGIFQRATSGDWKETGFIDGSSALQARRTRGQVPRGADYPTGVPRRFIPVPTNVYLPDGSGRSCNYDTAAFPARWPTGAAVMATNTSEVLVTYTEVCITHTADGGSAIQPEGWGYMLFNWRTQRIDRGPVDVFAPARSGAAIAVSKILGWPQFDGGQLTLFTSHCTSFFVVCKRGQVWSATMPATAQAMRNHTSYQLRPLATDGSGKWEPLTISVGRYPDGLRLIELTSIAGTYKIFSAPKAGARWQLEQSGTLPGCPTNTGFCFALEGHPELSTTTSTFVSYMDPEAPPGGHLVISALPRPVPARLSARGS